MNPRADAGSKHLARVADAGALNAAHKILLPWLLAVLLALKFCERFLF
ncbi:hypothetical protein [Rivihabitans pingtungensis]|nr:hypothetical protein [Rivihabitans pingtungensis]MCK6438484.1 hypothetical protein [Rivihabitans pingtungensis]